MDELLSKARVNEALGPVVTAEECVTQGQEFEKIKDFSAAEAAYRAAISLDGSTGRYRKSLARSLESQGRIDESLAVLQEISAWPGYKGDAQLYAMIGSLLIKKKDWGAAEQFLRKATALDATVNWYRNSLADVLAKVGQVDESLTISRELTLSHTHSRQATVHSRIGSLLLRKNEFEQAEEAFRESLVLDGTVAWVHRALGEVLARQGRLEDAVSSMRKSLNMDPNHSETIQKIQFLLSSQSKEDINKTPKAEPIGLSPTEIKMATKGDIIMSKDKKHNSKKISNKNTTSSIWSSIKNLFGA